MSEIDKPRLVWDVLKAQEVEDDLSDGLSRMGVAPPFGRHVRVEMVIGRGHDVPGGWGLFTESRLLYGLNSSARCDYM